MLCIYVYIRHRVVDTSIIKSKKYYVVIENLGFYVSDRVYIKGTRIIKRYIIVR